MPKKRGQMWTCQKPSLKITTVNSDIILNFCKQKNIAQLPVFVISKTDVEVQLGDGDALLKCFSPLFHSMRLFGLYFKQASSRIHDASTPTGMTAVSTKWNSGRVYAVIVMVVLWLNSARALSMFEKTDKFGYVLFMKLAMVSGILLSSVLQTSYFVGCETGNLDRVFLDARLPKSDHIRYRRLAIIHATACWVIIVAKTLIFAVPLFYEEGVLSFSMMPFGNHVVVSGQPILLMKLFTSLLYLFAYSAWIFPLSVNYIDYLKVLQCSRCVVHVQYLNQPLLYAPRLHFQL